MSTFAFACFCLRCYSHPCCGYSLLHCPSSIPYVLLSGCTLVILCTFAAVLLVCCVSGLCYSGRDNVDQMICCNSSMLLPHWSMQMRRSSFSTAIAAATRHCCCKSRYYHKIVCYLHCLRVNKTLSLSHTHGTGGEKPEELGD